MHIKIKYEQHQITIKLMCLLYVWCTTNVTVICRSNFASRDIYSGIQSSIQAYLHITVLRSPINTNTFIFFYHCLLLYNLASGKAGLLLNQLHLTYQCQSFRNHQCKKIWDVAFKFRNYSNNPADIPSNLAEHFILFLGLWGDCFFYYPTIPIHFNTLAECGLANLTNWPEGTKWLSG